MLQKTITLYNAEGRIIVNDDDKDRYLKDGYSKKAPKEGKTSDPKESPAPNPEPTPEPEKKPESDADSKAADKAPIKQTGAV